MSALLAYPARSPGFLWAWTPDALGSSLLAWWDAERSDLITQSGGAVSSWKDSVAGYDAVQAIGAARPTYSATSFNGRPGVSLDGTDDELTYPSTAGLPTAGTGTEIHTAADQSALPGDATNRHLFSYGGATNATMRAVRRTVLGGVNRGNFLVGDGSALQSVSNLNADLSGRSVARSQATGSAMQIDVNGVTGSSGSVVPNSGTTRTRIGASTAAVAASFWQGVINSIVVTAPLSAGQAAQLYAYLNRRL